MTKKVDETGVPGKPYIGAKGPRKSKPNNRHAKAAEDETVVKELFTEEKRTSFKPKPPGTRKTKRMRKVRLSTNWSAALDRIDEEGITMEEFVATLTPEELARGRLKNADGTFRGAPSRWVPAEFHKECVRELMRRGKELYQENYIQAIQAMTTIATTPSIEVNSRIKAAQFVIERIEGKVPEKLEIGVSEPWQELLSGVVATIDPSSVPVRGFHEAGGAPGTPEAEGGPPMP